LPAKLDSKVAIMIYRKPDRKFPGAAMKPNGKLLLLGVVLFGLLAISRNADAQVATQRAAYTAFAAMFTILWVGKDAGLYQKFGADMERLYIGSSSKSVQAFLGGDIDIMYSAAGAVVDANLGLEKMYDNALLQEIQKEATK
jgi:hypothetical protein